MKKSKTVLFVLITTSVTYINTQSVINNLLNKKYIVNEIVGNHTEKSLKGIYKVIDSDYASFRWIVLTNTLYVLILAVYILYFNSKESKGKFRKIN